ncbi:MAG TPA: AAA family ATPase [Terracidiphilus sp.]|jgi:hypothetical protein
MIKSIQINGYRGFSEFEMKNLGRVNLLVGTNNSGKTSALEALYLLVSQGDPSSLWRVLWRRSERLPDRPSRPSPELDMCHLFTGHEIRMGSKFTFSAENQTPGRHLSFSIGEISDETRVKNTTREVVALPSRFGLHIKGNPSPPAAVIPLTRSGGLPPEALEIPRRMQRRNSGDDEVHTQFITAESYGGSELVSLWESVALTSNEERVLNALRLLEPEIERIASISLTPDYYGGGNQRGGFRVKFKDQERPIPIGSLGDGIWRLLVMAIAIAQCKDGLLLIDEIDTGLHYSVMTAMWRLIYGAAKELNVQVFATTHSNDCIRSLAEVCCAEDEAGSNVTLQRIERGRKKSVPYTSKEIEVAADRGIEVR